MDKWQVDMGCVVRMMMAGSIGNLICWGFSLYSYMCSSHSIAATAQPQLNLALISSECYIFYILQRLR